MRLENAHYLKKQELLLQSHIVRGILIGGSIGVLAGVFKFVDMGRGAALGMLMGFLAGLHLERKRAKEVMERDKIKQQSEDED